MVRFFIDDRNVWADTVNKFAFLRKVSLRDYNFGFQ